MQAFGYLQTCYDCEDGVCVVHTSITTELRIQELHSHKVIRCSCCAIINTESYIYMDGDLCLNCGIKGAWQIIDKDSLKNEKPFTYLYVVLKVNTPEAWTSFLEELHQFFLRYFDGIEELVNSLDKGGLSLKLYLALDSIDKPEILDYLTPCPRLAKLYSRGLITKHEMWKQQILKDNEE